MKVVVVVVGGIKNIVAEWRKKTEISHSSCVRVVNLLQPVTVSFLIPSLHLSSCVP